MKIDVIVPYHSRESSTLNWCVQGIKKHIEVGRVLVVCNREYRMRVESTGAIFFDEDMVVEGLTAQSYTHSRWGWYFQQILKLGMADWVESQYFLVIDSDTVFLRPVRFFNQFDKPLYATGSEFHQPYFTTIEQLLNFKANREYSFVAHHMVFNKSIVIEMREKFKKHKIWYDNILSCYNSSTSDALFSEYETYGHYIKTFHPDELNLRQLKWANIAYDASERIFQRLSKYFDYCSLHAHSRSDKSLAGRINRKMYFEWRLMKERLEIR